MPRTLLNPLMYGNQWKDVLITEPGTTTVKMPKGIYQVVVRGAGGAGGVTGGNFTNSYTSTGGVGGCGGCGKLTVSYPNITSPVTATVCVGSQGLTYANGGNGGAGGLSAGNGAPNAGAGGGGGFPSYLQYSDTDIISANGGGGGGGGGGAATHNKRYDRGGAGGGGGGFYDIALVDGEIVLTSVAGKAGHDGAAQQTAGVSGPAGDGDPDLYSGAGGRGTGGNGGAQSFGGGAGGASGGGGPGNSNTGAGGQGGGGAPGCKDAGGGGNANNPNYGSFNSSIVSYNAKKTIPTDPTSENALYGIIGNYGIGGTTNTNGTGGFAVIRRIGKVQPISEIIDCGNVKTSTVEIEWTQEQPGTTAFDTISDYFGVTDGTNWWFFSHSGYVTTTTDLETFTPKVSSNITPESVVLVGNKFVSIDLNGIVKTADKTDPTTWTQVADLSSINASWGGLCVGNNEVLAYGSSTKLAKTTDLTNFATWNEVTYSGYYGGATDNGICWNGSQYLALSSFSYPMVYSSPDGVNWTYLGRVNASLSASPRLLGWSCGRYVQISNSGKVYESEDGINWTLNDEDVPFSTCRAGGFSADGTKIVVVSAYGGVIAIADNTVIVDPLEEIIDCGAINSTVANTINCGNIM